MNRNMGLLFISIVIFLLFTGCGEQPTMAEGLAKPFQETLDTQHKIEHTMQAEHTRLLRVPGLSAAVILPDGTLWRGASGISSDQEAMNSDILFGLSSVSKTYIAALVVQLAEEGMLDVDDPVLKWLPELSQVDGSITIRQLLNHTSGLYPYQRKPEYLAAISAQPDRAWEPQEIWEEFQGTPECQPG